MYNAVSPCPRAHCCHVVKSFHETCLTAVTQSKVYTNRVPLLSLSRGQTLPRNGKPKKKYKNEKLIETCLSHGVPCLPRFSRISQKLQIKKRLKNIEFASASLSQNFHSRVCCMHFKSRKNDKILAFFRVHCTYVTSSCTQGPSRPGFYEAKCSSKIQLFYNSVDFLLFYHRRTHKFLEFLTLPQGVQSMNRPHKLQYLGIVIASEHSCWQLLRGQT